MTTVSVLIASHNRTTLLKRAILSILHGDTLPDEIVIVHTGSEAVSDELKALDAQNAVRLVVLSAPNQGPAQNRNLGITRCTGDLVAITDDDVEVSQTWIQKIKQLHLEHAEAAAIGGRTVGIDSETSLLSFLMDIIYFPQGTEAGYVRTLPTVNISYKRPAMLATGDMDVNLRYGEDVDFNWRLLQAGHKIYYAPELLVRHENVKSLRALLSKAFTSGIYYLRVRRKWDSMYSIFPTRFSKPKDAAKLVYFYCSAAFEPLRVISKIPGWRWRMLGIPVVYLWHITWKLGITLEALRKR